MTSVADGVRLVPEYLSPARQTELLAIVRQIVKQAPLYTPALPKTGKPMSVRMTNCGALGWVTDQTNGYRYQSHHPVSGIMWPDMPEFLQDVWLDLADYPLPAEACLINFYDTSAKMGMHQDRDEHNLGAPVVSLSLGDDCLFRVGGLKRGGATKSFRLQSGDALILAGASRMAFHGVDKIYPGTSMLLKGVGRINLTLRRVNN